MIEIEKNWKMNILNWHFLKFEYLIEKMIEYYRLQAKFFFYIYIYIYIGSPTNESSYKRAARSICIVSSHKLKYVLTM
jgi:hypothetical protein